MPKGVYKRKKKVERTFGDVVTRAMPKQTQVSVNMQSEGVILKVNDAFGFLQATVIITPEGLNVMTPNAKKKPEGVLDFKKLSEVLGILTAS